MITLASSTQSLEFLLGEAITTTALSCIANYAEVALPEFNLTTFVSNDQQSNNTTAVTMVAAPVAGRMRQVKYFSTQNADTKGHDVIVQINDNGTPRLIGKWFLQTGDTLLYVDGRGWYVLATNGKIRVTQPASVSSGGGSTVTFDGNSAHFLRGDNAFAQISLTAAVSGVLPVANGGLNLSSYAQGDIIYASAADTPAKLGIGANGKFLLSNGTIPGWSLIPALSATYFTSLSAASLTSIPAGQLTGAIADARLSANVALLNAVNVFTNTNTFSNQVNLNAATVINGARFDAGYISGGALTAGNNNDFSPSGYATCNVILLSGDGSGTSILTGLNGGTTGRIVRLIWLGGGNITITNGDTASASNNRFAGAAVLGATKTSVALWYYADYGGAGVGRWALLG